MRSLGAATAPRPRADAGTSVGKPIAAVAAAVLDRNPRREMRSVLDTSGTPRAERSGRQAPGPGGFSHPALDTIAETISSMAGPRGFGPIVTGVKAVSDCAGRTSDDAASGAIVPCVKQKRRQVLMSTIELSPAIGACLLDHGWIPSPLYRMTVEQYEAMVASGVFSKKDRFHLINGYLVAKMTQNPPHWVADELCGVELARIVPADRYRIPGGQADAVSRVEPASPSPTAASCGGRFATTRAGIPGRRTSSLVVEVADSSLADDRQMGSEVYGPAGIPVYWIVNLIHRQVEVYTDPGPEGYRSCAVFAAGQSVPVVIDGQPLGQIAVADLLPSRSATPRLSWQWSRVKSVAAGRGVAYSQVQALPFHWPHGHSRCMDNDPTEARPAMKTIVLALLGVAGTAGSSGRPVGAVGLLDAKPPLSREQCDKLVQQGNYKDAYEGYRALALDPKDDPKLVGRDLQQAIFCLLNLGRMDEIDAFREAVIEVHKDNWRLLEAAAESYLNGQRQFGFIVAGEFHRESDQGADGTSTRGAGSGPGIAASGSGAGSGPGGPRSAGAGRYMLTLARALLVFRQAGESWRLQNLTHSILCPTLTSPSLGSGMASSRGTCARLTGLPSISAIRMTSPRRRMTASGGGGRWPRLSKSIRACSTRRSSSRRAFCSACSAPRRWEEWLRSGAETDRAEPLDLHALQTLKDEETIARLAIGIKRFTLPDEFNPIKIYQTIADDPGTGHGEDALAQLASIFENRRQFDRAAGYLKRSKQEYGDPYGGKNQRVQQILGAWGQFEPIMTQPAGQGATVGFRFRNGRRVRFEAHEVLVDKVLRDVKEYIGSRPPSSSTGSGSRSTRSVPVWSRSTSSSTWAGSSPAGSWSWSRPRGISTSGSP